MSGCRYLNKKNIKIMAPQNILKTDFLDILFEGRNKAYGAYVLRRTYNSRLVKAVIAALLLVCLLLLASSFKKKTEATLLSGTEKDEIVRKADEPEKAKIPEQPKPKPEQQKVKTPNATPVAAPPTIHLTRVLDVTTTFPPTPDVDGDLQSGTENNPDGVPPTTLTPPTPPPGNPGEGGDGKDKPVVEDDKVYVGVQIEARFDGSFKKYLEDYLRYPSDAAEAGVEGIVIIRFVVDKEGNISNMEVAENSPQKNASLVAEAKRIIKKSSGKWIAGIQNGSPVKSFHEQSIRFVLPAE
jgi:periplasmic protein TonB